MAVAVRDGQVAAYVCDGKSVESWLTGTAVGTTATLSAGGDRLVAYGPAPASSLRPPVLVPGQAVTLDDQQAYPQG